MQIKNNKIKQLPLIIGMAISGMVLIPQNCSATYLTADYGIGEDLYLKVDGVESAHWAGSIKIDVDGSHRIALCVDLFTMMNVNQAYGTNLGLSGQINNGGRVAWLLDNELPVLHSASELAGLQLAIWDIVSDNGNGLSSGRIQAPTLHSTDVFAMAGARSLIALSAGKSSTDGIVYSNFNLSTGGKVQTLMGVPDVINNHSGIPEPQSFVMIGIGGLAGLWLKLKLKRK